MKRKISLTILFTMIISALTGCSQKTVDINFSPFQAKLSFGDVNEEKIEKMKKEENIKEIKVNEDNSLLLTIEEENYKKIMNELNLHLAAIIEYIETGDDFNFVEKLEFDEVYSQVKVSVDKNKLKDYIENPESKFSDSPLESLVIFLGRVLSVYKGYSNTGELINFNMVDSKSDEIIKELELPRDYNEILELN